MRETGERLKFAAPLQGHTKRKVQGLFMLKFLMNLDHRNSLILFIVEIQIERSTRGRTEHHHLSHLKQPQSSRHKLDK